MKMRRLRPLVFLPSLFAARYSSLSADTVRDLPDCQALWRQWEEATTQGAGRRRRRAGARISSPGPAFKGSFEDVWRSHMVSQSRVDQPSSNRTPPPSPEGEVLQLVVSRESCCRSSIRLLTALTSIRGNPAGLSFRSIRLVLGGPDGDGSDSATNPPLSAASLAPLLQAAAEALKSVNNASVLCSVRSLSVSEVRLSDYDTLWGRGVRSSSSSDDDIPIRVLSRIIREAPQLESISLERLSWRDANPSDLRCVSEAISSRGVSTSASLGLKGLHLRSMEPLLRCRHFMEDCVPCLKRLEDLSLDDCDLTMMAAAVSEEEKKSHPTVTLWQQLLSALLKGVGGWHRLRRLSIASCGISGAELREALDSLPANHNPRDTHLAELNISHNRLTHHSTVSATDLTFFVASFFARVRQLEVLEARHCGLLASDVEALSSVTGSNPAHVCRLHRLHLDSNPISDKGLSALIRGGGSQWPLLTSLSLSRCGLTCRSLIPLYKLLGRRAAGTTDLSRTSSSCPQLKSLCLAMNDLRPLSPEDCKRAALSSRFPGDSVDDEELQLFCYDSRFMAGDEEFRNRGTHKVPTSYELDRRDAEEGRVRYRGLNEQGPPAPAPAVSLPSSSREVWQRFGEAITSGCPLLQSLDLRYVGLCASDATSFFTSLRLPRLVSLLMACNAQLCSSVDSSDALFDCVQFSASTIRVLDLSSTSFNDYSASLVCDGHCEQDDAVLPSWRLRSLLLSHTAITDEGVQLLVEAFRRGEEALTAQQLSCSRVKISAQSRQLLRRLLDEGLIKQLET